MTGVIKLSLIAGVSLMVLSTPSWAQVIAQLPNPHAATCGDFKHHRAAGTWSPKGEIQITSSSGTTSLSPGNSFAAGQVLNGYDLGKWLDTNCHHPKFW